LRINNIKTRYIKGAIFGTLGFCTSWAVSAKGYGREWIEVIELDLEFRPGAEAWAATHENVTVRWHDWWKAPRTMAAVRQIDQEASHASWMEGFPWTQVAGVEAPTGHKASVDLSGREKLTAGAFRERLGDGSFGGYYTRPTDELLAVWAVAVEETRALMEEGWGS